MPPFTTAVPLRFGDCDPAGIAYYPSILHLQHTVFEAFWEEGVGFSYARLMGERRLGFPTRRLECDFREPLRYGDVLTVTVEVGGVGRTSAEFRYAIARPGGGAPAAGIVARTVCVDMDGLRPVPVPDDLREALRRFRRDGD